MWDTWEKCEKPLGRLSSENVSWEMLIRRIDGEVSQHSTLFHSNIRYRGRAT